MYTYIYIWIYTHTHTHTHTQRETDTHTHTHVPTPHTLTHRMSKFCGPPSIILSLLKGWYKYNIMDSFLCYLKKPSVPRLLSSFFAPSCVSSHTNPSHLHTHIHSRTDGGKSCGVPSE